MHKKQHTAQMKNIILLALAAIIWGVSFVAQSDAMNYVGVFTFNFARYIVGGVVLLPFTKLFSEGEVQQKQKSGIDSMVIISGMYCGIVLFIGSSLQLSGIKYTTAGKAGFITALYIVLVPVFGIFIKKRVGVRTWFGVALAVGGLYLLCITEAFAVGAGDAYLLGGAIAFSVHILLIDYFASKMNAVKLACSQFMVAGGMFFVCMLIWEAPAVADILAGWLPILYAGVLSSGVAFTFQIIGQRNMNPSAASLILSFEAVVSVIAGFLLLGEKLSMREMAGCVLMFAAIILAQLPDKTTE